MPDTFTLDFYLPAVGQGFRLNNPDYQETLTLVSATPVRHAPPPGFPPGFLLIFEGENPSVMLSQHIYRLENETLGAVELFLACIGRKPAGTFTYQAVFG